jgi:N,N'-diacetylchitobiose transport system permease protein
VSSPTVLERTADAAGGSLSRRRQRRSNGLLPYALVAPVVAVLAAVLAYPVYRVVRLSFEHYGLEQLTGLKPNEWVGLRNYRELLDDPVFFHVLVRTLVMTGAMVGMTIGLGLLLALMLRRTASWLRRALTTGLVIVWAMPPVVAVQVWYYLFKSPQPVANYVLADLLHIHALADHSWFGSPFEQLGMVTLLVVWVSLPFVVISLYAGLSQVPDELLEAAAVDGAGAWHSFWSVTFPILKPILLILTSLSVIWDFGVFTQPYLLIEGPNLNEGNYVLGVFAFQKAFRESNYGYGAAISIAMLLIVAALSVGYVRQMLRVGEVE